MYFNISEHYAINAYFNDNILINNISQYIIDISKTLKHCVVYESNIRIPVMIIILNNYIWKYDFKKANEYFFLYYHRISL